MGYNGPPPGTEKVPRESKWFLLFVAAFLGLGAFAVWCAEDLSRTEVAREAFAVESVEHAGGFLEGHRTVLHLEGGGVIVLKGIRSVPSGDVTISQRRDGSYVIEGN